MSKTRPGIDRIDKQWQQTIVHNVSQLIHEHELMCVQCATSGSDIYARCEVWWKHAKALHKARRKLRAYSTDQIPGQQELPGMEAQ